MAPQSPGRLTPGRLQAEAGARRSICWRVLLTLAETSGSSALRFAQTHGAGGAGVLVALDEPQVICQCAIERILEREAAAPSPSAWPVGTLPRNAACVPGRRSVRRHAVEDPRSERQALPRAAKVMRPTCSCPLLRNPGCHVENRLDRHLIPDAGIDHQVEQMPRRPLEIEVAL